VSKALDFGAQDTLKVILTTEDGKGPTRAHQVFLNLLDPGSGLETSFPFQVKDSGKSKIELVHIFPSWPPQAVD
jgi:oligosaccharyltransferase complex subunit delta (ribophorin II)